MTSKFVALVLLCLMTGTAMAQEPKVTSLMSKRSYGESRQGSSDDHSRACARRVDRYPPTQCTCVCLRTRGLHRDAAEGWRTGNTDTRTDLLRRPRRCSCRWPERKQHQAGEICGVLDQEQGGSGARASRVTPDRGGPKRYRRRRRRGLRRRRECLGNAIEQDGAQVDSRIGPRKADSDRRPNGRNGRGSPNLRSWICAVLRRAARLRSRSRARGR